MTDKQLIALYRDLVNRLHLTCDDFHHDFKDRHEFDETCPVMAKFKQILPEEC